MKSKKFTILIIMNVVFVLAMIGLAIGLVLVAQQATLNNNMSIRYEAKNVDATIEVSAMNYANATGTSDNDKVIAIGDDKLETSTITFSATQSTTTGELEFETAELTALGRAEYKFTITNTATATNTNTLYVLATVNNLTEDDNIDIQFSTDSSYNRPILSQEDNVRWISIGPGQTSRTFYVTAKITNASISIDNFEFGIDLKLQYAGGYINNFAWGNADDELIIGVKNDSNVASTIGHGTYNEVLTNTLYSNTTHGTSLVVAETLPLGNDGEVGYIHLYVPSGAPALYTFELLTPSGEYCCGTLYYDGTDGFMLNADGSKDTSIDEYYDKDYDKCVYFYRWDGKFSFGTDALDGIWDLADNPWEYGTKLLITITPIA